MAAAAEFFSFHETDIDGAQDAVGKNYFIARMDLLDVASLRPVSVHHPAAARAVTSAGHQVILYTTGDSTAPQASTVIG